MRRSGNLHYAECYLISLDSARSSDVKNYNDHVEIGATEKNEPIPLVNGSKTEEEDPQCSCGCGLLK